MKRWRKIFISAVLTSIGMSLMDMENPPEAQTQQKADDWVRMMNKFMPFTDEVLVVGIKGVLQDVQILQNMGRLPEVIKDPERSDAIRDGRQRIRAHAYDIADHITGDHILALDVVSIHPSPRVPIMPTSSSVVLLSVSRRSGDIGLVDIMKGSFTVPSRDNLLDQVYKCYDYDHYMICRVLMHEWPD